MMATSLHAARVGALAAAVAMMKRAKLEVLREVLLALLPDLRLRLNYAIILPVSHAER